MQKKCGMGQKHRIPANAPEGEATRYPADFGIRKIVLGYSKHRERVKTNSQQRQGERI